MYETVYEDMVNCNIAEKIENEVYVNIRGEIEIDKEKRCGLPTRYLMKRPDLVVFVDETGCNTNQKSDPLNGNEKRIVGRKNYDGFGLIGLVTDNHYSVLCFQSATGEPIMCAIIFKSESKVRQIPQHWISGIDIRKINKATNLPKTDESIAAMYVEEGENGAIGGGPSCYFRGIKIPCYCCCSASASISSTLLTDMLRYMNSFNIFDRTAGEKPLLLLDGHHSRMDLEFLEYINTNKHMWHVNIGVPYGTHIWQVADSSQVNGLFKMKVAETKRQYNELKGTQSLLMSDIVPIVNTAFDASFRNAENTRHAISERGWGPSLNYCLLLDERLNGAPKNTEQSTVTASTSTNTNSTITDVEWNGGVKKFTVKFNNTKGFAAVMTDKIVDNRKRQEGRAKAAEERVRIMEDRDKHVKIIKNLPKMSSGQLMANGWLRMDKTVLENQRKRQQQANEKTQQQKIKKQKQDNKQSEEYQLTKEKLTMKDYHALLKQASVKGDSALKKTRLEVMHQLSRRIDRLKQFLPIAIFNMIKEHALPLCNTEVIVQPYNIEVIPPASLTNEELVLFEDINSTTTLPTKNAINVQPVQPSSIRTMQSMQSMQPVQR
jgi:hypothetical protein